MNHSTLTRAFGKVEEALRALVAKRPGKVVETGALQRTFRDANWGATLAEAEEEAPLLQ